MNPDVVPRIPRALVCGAWLLLVSAWASAQPSEAPIPVVPGSPSPVALEIWNSPAFQRQFAESYLAETEIEPRVTTTERDQMQKVLELIAGGQMEKAEQVLKKLTSEAATAVYDFTLANIYFQLDRHQEAALAYRKAIDKYPKFRRAWKNLGLIHIRQGEFDKAVPALTRVVELGGNDATIYGLLGYASAMLDQHLAAESAYRLAILLDPGTLDWKMGLAHSLFKQDRYAEAAALCGQLIQEQPSRADFWLLQANAYIGMKQPLKAAEVFEILNHLGQSTTESLKLLGDIYVNEGLYELAVQSYLQALDKTSQADPDPYIRAANVLAAHGAVAETRRLVEHLEQRLKERLSPDARKDLLKLRARLAVAEGAGAEEARVLEEIVALDPFDGEALILLGQHSSRNGNPEKAIFYYERAAAIERFEADAKVRHAQVLIGQGQYEAALPLLRRAQQINPRDNVEEYLAQVERIVKSR